MYSNFDKPFSWEHNEILGNYMPNNFSYSFMAKEEEKKANLLDPTLIFANDDSSFPRS